MSESTKFESNLEVTPRSDCELACHRDFKANSQDIYAAIRDPEKLARWWGPRGFSNSFETFEFKEGGRWIFVMHGPDGKNYQNRSEFHSINENQGLQIRHLSAPHYNAEIRLIPMSSGTRVAFYQCFESAEMCRKIASFVGPANHENLARLAALLGEAEWP